MNLWLYQNHNLAPRIRAREFDRPNLVVKAQKVYGFAYIQRGADGKLDTAHMDSEAWLHMTKDSPLCRNPLYIDHSNPIDDATLALWVEGIARAQLLRPRMPKWIYAWPRFGEPIKRWAKGLHYADAIHYDGKVDGSTIWIKPHLDYYDEVAGVVGDIRGFKCKCVASMHTGTDVELNRPLLEEMLLRGHDAFLWHSRNDEDILAFIRLCQGVCQ